jgi:secreted Zn-dependent insulinase-like peptidase
MGLRKAEAAQEIVKPLSFKAQEFKRVVLDNHLEFLLVSDPELDKAGAAIDVRLLHIFILDKHLRQLIVPS